jgi:hypothetical protein
VRYRVPVTQKPRCEPSGIQCSSDIGMLACAYVAFLDGHVGCAGYDEPAGVPSRTLARMVTVEEVAAMNGSPGIDPQMIRDHDGDADALQQSIRAIQLDALKQQARLSLARPMAKERALHWWRRSA